MANDTQEWSFVKIFIIIMYNLTAEQRAPGRDVTGGGHMQASRLGAPRSHCPGALLPSRAVSNNSMITHLDVINFVKPK